MNKKFDSDDGVKNFRYIVAQWISHFLNPIVIAFFILLWRAWSIPIANLDFIIFLVAYVLVPIGSVLFMIFTNRINSIYPKNRKQREYLLIIGLTTYSVGWLIAFTLSIDNFLLMLASVYVLATIAVVCINRFWRISIHCIGVSGAATLLIDDVGEIGIYLGLLSMIITAWARLYLNAHTFSQVLAGLLLGTTIGFIAILNIVSEV